MKSKTKKIIKIKNKPTTRARKKNLPRYQAYVLAIVIASLLLLEGALISITTPADWQESMSLLNMRPATSESIAVLAQTLEPMAEVARKIMDFYTLATDAAMPLLDLDGIGEDFVLVFNSISLFYEESSIQMAVLLDISEAVGSTGTVAGISILR